MGSNVVRNRQIVKQKKSPGAIFRLADGVGKHCRNFMITNANPGNGNSNISLRGGVWDANNAGNPRGTDYEPFAYTGVAINFTNVRGLTLRDFTVHNPESFFVRVGEVCDFHIENIHLSADELRPNQDAIHVGGFSERGAIRRVRFADIDLAKTEWADVAPAIVKVSLSVDDVEIRRLQRREATLPEVKTLVIDNNQHLNMVLEGQTSDVASATGFVLANGDIEELRVHNKKLAESATLPGRLI